MKTDEQYKKLENSLADQNSKLEKQLQEHKKQFEEQKQQFEGMKNQLKNQQMEQDEKLERLIQITEALSIR